MEKILSFLKKCFSKEGMKKFYFSFVWLIVVIFAADLISKWAVQNSLETAQTVPLIPGFLNVTLVHNLGAAFSLGSNGEIGWRIVWISVSVLMSFGLSFFYIKKIGSLKTWTRVAVTMIIAGAVGNMIDRCFYWNAIVGFDGVIDWIDFQFGTWHFATFNLADSSLVIGVAILILIVIVDSIKETMEKNKRGEYDLKPQDYKKQQEENNAKDSDNKELH